MLTRNANISSLTSCEQPEVVEEFRWAGGGEGTWAPSAGLSAAGRGHRAGLTGCSLHAAFSGRRKTGSDSSCSPRMLNQPWWVSDGELSDSATFCMLTYCTSSSSIYTWMTLSLCQAGRLLLRKFVCEKMEVPWSEIRLERSPRGKPYLAAPLKVKQHFTSRILLPLIIHWDQSNNSIKTSTFPLSNIKGTLKHHIFTLKVF